tara:strand:- start:115 stop:525 length:411 start_codon:yes stop_codon:yes gene_type:complete
MRFQSNIKKAIFFLIIPILISFGEVYGQSYGRLIEYGEDELYYTSSVTSREAHKLGDYLVEQEFFSDQGVAVQLNKDRNTYEFKMVIKEGLEHDTEFIDIMKEFIVMLEEDVFDGSQVDIHLCDGYFNTLRVVVVF